MLSQRPQHKDWCASKKNCHEKCRSLMVLLSLLGTFGCIAVAIDQIPLDESGEYLECVLENSVNGILKGDGDMSWIGLENIESALGEVISEFKPPKNEGQMNSISELGEIRQIREELIEELGESYMNHRAFRFNRADPDKNSLYQPAFVGMLGPYTKEMTHTYDVYQEVDHKYTMLNDTISNLQTLNKMFKMDSALNRTIDTRVQSVNERVKELTHDVKELILELGLFEEIEGQYSIKEEHRNALTPKSTTYAIITAAVGVAGTLLLIFSGIKNNKNAKHYYLIAIMLALLTIINLYNLHNKAQTYNYILDTIVTYNRTIAEPLKLDRYINQNIQNPILNKLAQDSIQHTGGELAEHIKLKLAIGALQIFYTSLQALNQIKEEPYTQVLSQKVEELKMLKDGLYLDSGETLIDLKKLNNYTNNPTQLCLKGTHDTFVLNTLNCSEEYGNRFSSIYPESHGQGEKMCIGFDEWDEQKDPRKRYKPEYFEGCNSNRTVDDWIDYLAKYIIAMAEHRNKIEDRFGTLLEDFRRFQVINNKFMDKLILKVNELDQNLEGMSSIEDGLDKLIYGTNLSLFFKSSLLSINEAASENFAVEYAEKAFNIRYLVYFGMIMVIGLYILGRTSQSKEERQGLEMVELADEEDETEQDEEEGVPGEDSSRQLGSQSGSR